MSEKRYTVYEGPRVVKTIGSPNPGLTASTSNEDTELKAIEDARKFAESLKPKFITHTVLGKGGDELDPDPQRRLALERTIQYSEVQNCEFCKDQIVYRTSDTIYSPMRGTDRSVLTNWSYPSFIPIDINTTQRDRFGNFQSDLGEYSPHFCDPKEIKTTEEWGRYVEHLNKQNVEFNRWVFQEIRRMKKEFTSKPFYVDRD